MQRILVTGANKGIGYAIVNAILSQRPETFVFLGSRDWGRGERARQQLVASHPEWAGRLEALELDVSSTASVSNAAARVQAQFQDEPAPLFAVVNNAGIGGSAGLRAVLEVNIFGVRRVCESFLPLLDPERGPPHAVRSRAPFTCLPSPFGKPRSSTRRGTCVYPLALKHRFGLCGVHTPLDRGSRTLSHPSFQNALLEPRLALAHWDAPTGGLARGCSGVTLIGTPSHH